jgi:hypothetical protein
MQIPFNTPLGFLGFLMLGLGVFLLLAGLSIVNVEKITVKPGRITWGFGIIFSILGVMLVLLGDPGKEPEITATSTPTVATVTNVETPAIAPTTEPSPTTSKLTSEYALLAEASMWPVTETDSFDDPNPDWVSFGTYEDQWVKHNQRIEEGKLIWGMELISPNLWYWQASPYYSYRDFYLSLKFRRDVSEGNSTYYGLYFRKQGNKVYHFRIDESQRFAVQLFDNDNWTDLIGWTKSAEIKLGKFNELTVIADGPNMTFYINKTYVGDVNDETLTNGEVGFTFAVNESGPETVLEVDDFELREKP